MTIKWADIIKEVAIELENYKREGYDKPTLRSMFYRLYDRELFPNTRSSYNSLGDATVKARMDGRLPIDCFYDEVRDVVMNFDETYGRPDAWIDLYIDKLKELPDNYQSLIPRWYRQPNYVEVWVEKRAMIGSLRPLVFPKHVRIVPFSGYTSLTFLKEAADRIFREHFMENRKVYIFYFGDFDPSGDYMPEDLEERLGMGNGIKGDKKEKGLEVWQYIEQFKHVAITKEQRDRFKLPEKFDADTEEKLMRDTRGPRFLKKYKRFYQNEIDSLPARKPREFREMVTRPIDELFDEDIYQKLLEKYSADDIGKMLKSKVKFLSRH